MQNQAKGIICYWEYKKEYILVESFLVDEDLYPLTKPSAGGEDRHEWFKWTNTKYGSFESKSIMGRAVTCFTIRSGVRLLDFNPPEWCSWLSSTFYDDLLKLSNWSSLINCGYNLSRGTQEEAEKYFKIQ